jgi:16S rRNA (cytidine1402-2'-O)-methyltransferase
MSGRLVFAATPIGNVSDASARLRALLASADVVAAEDTRRTADLARRLELRITGRLVSLHDHNESDRAETLLRVVRDGGTVLVVSDAGTPGISDPGYRLVQAAIASGVPVTVAPGPSAVLAGLLLSGLPTDRFCFEGFMPRKSGERQRKLQALAAEPRTMVFFESPRRLADSLTAAVDVFGGDREGAVCRELTKTHEQVIRGTLAELAKWARSRHVLGEIVLVVAGAQVQVAISAAVAEIMARRADGERLKDAARAVASATGLSSKELYSAALAARSEKTRSEESSG